MLTSEVLASFVTGLRADKLDAPVIEAGKRAILDTVGVTIGALADESSGVIRNFAKYLGNNSSRASIVGSTARTTPDNAALINGTLAHLLDYDDSHNPMGGHPSAPAFVAALAAAEDVGASGLSLLTGFLAGFEVETRLARVMNPLHYERGWHPTSVLACVGCAATAAKILELEETQTQMALCTAASLSFGMRASFGTLTKPLHIGKAAQAGVQAAYLARLGHTANPEIFEAKMGFFDLFCSQNPEDWKLDTLARPFGEPWEIISPGLTVKPYPCGGSTHSTIDAHLELRHETGLAPGDIKQIVNGIHRRRLPHTNRSTIGSGLEGKFSNQYVTALSWVHGKIPIEAFNDSALQNQQVMELMKRVEVVADPNISAAEVEIHAAVEVVTHAGSIYKKKITRRKGTTDNPLTERELLKKFQDCVAGPYSQSDAEKLAETIMSLNRLSDISILTKQISCDPLKTG